MEIKRILIMLIISASVVGCSRERPIKNRSAEDARYEIICIDGVQYLSRHDAVTGHFKRDGSLHICGEVE